jgi:hypothetical protein
VEFVDSSELIQGFELIMPLLGVFDHVWNPLINETIPVSGKQMRFFKISHVIELNISHSLLLKSLVLFFALFFNACFKDLFEIS